MGTRTDEIAAEYRRREQIEREREQERVGALNAEIRATLRRLAESR